VDYPWQKIVQEYMQRFRERSDAERSHYLLVHRRLQGDHLLS
jgi:hypothetical protein